MRRFVITLSFLSFVTITLSGCSPEMEKKLADAGSDAANAAMEKAGDAVESAKSSVADAMGKATESLAGIEGGADMLKNITDLFSKASTTLSGVSDEASATAALPEIHNLTESFGSFTEIYNQLPDAAKSAVAGVFTSSLSDLKPMLEKILAIPGAQSILKPALDALMAKLQSFQA
jgi:uncharacterized phage infection (PIP) family protein YhgE